MRVRITDDRIPGEDLVIAVNEPEYMEDSILLTEDEALKLVEFWEGVEVGERSSYDLTEDGIIVLADVPSADGRGIELFAWYEEADGQWPLEGFPCTSLHFKVEGVA